MKLGRLVPAADNDDRGCPDPSNRSPTLPLSTVCGGRRTVVAVVTDPNTARSLLDGLRIPHRSPVFTARGPSDLFDDPSPAFEADPPAPDE